MSRFMSGRRARAEASGARQQRQGAAQHGKQVEAARETGGAPWPASASASVPPASRCTAACRRAARRRRSATSHGRAAVGALLAQREPRARRERPVPSERRRPATSGSTAAGVVAHLQDAAAARRSPVRARPAGRRERAPQQGDLLRRSRGRVRGTRRARPPPRAVRWDPRPCRSRAHASAAAARSGAVGGGTRIRTGE